MSLYTPVTENMKLDMRMNLKAKKVVSSRCCNAHTAGSGNLCGIPDAYADPYPVQEAGKVNAEDCILCRWN